MENQYGLSAVEREQRSGALSGISIGRERQTSIEQLADKISAVAGGMNPDSLHSPATQRIRAITDIAEQAQSQGVNPKHWEFKKVEWEDECLDHIREDQLNQYEVQLEGRKKGARNLGICFNFKKYLRKFEAFESVANWLDDYKMTTFTIEVYTCYMVHLFEPHPPNA